MFILLAGGWAINFCLIGNSYLTGKWAGKWNPTMLSISASIGSFTCLIFFVIGMIHFRYDALLIDLQVCPKK